MTDAAKERWASGDLYEPYVGRWSRPVARELLGWLNAPTGLAWLEVGCGTGALVGAIAKHCAPKRLVGIDPSAGFLELARRRLAGGTPSCGKSMRRTCPSPRARSIGSSPAWCSISSRISRARWRRSSA